jgi:ParB family transcriptional regulator, chromosome partitioning protein
MIEEPRRRGLGRGLSALLGEEDAAPAAATLMVRIDALRPGRYQPRHRFDSESIDALAQSMREKGILQPLLVRHVPGSGDSYEIIAGERRWRAAQAAQLHEVPVLLREIGDREALEIALIENLQRENLSPLEEAAAYQRLMQDFQNTQDTVAGAVGKSRSHVANMMRLLELPEPVKQLLDEGKLSAGHGRALLTAVNPEALAREAVRRGLSVRTVERLAKRPPATAALAESMAEKDADTRAVEQTLSATLGLTVQIERRGPGGKVTIRYQSLEQLDDVLRRLSQAPPGSERLG